MFSKSKRFAESASNTPGPGTYEPKARSLPGAAFFGRSQRFSDSSDNEGSVGKPHDSILVTPVKSACEFKIPSTSTSKQRSRVKSWKKSCSSQTDLAGDGETHNINVLTKEKENLLDEVISLQGENSRVLQLLQNSQSAKRTLEDQLSHIANENESLASKIKAVEDDMSKLSSEFESRLTIEKECNIEVVSKLETELSVSKQQQISIDSQLKNFLEQEGTLRQRVAELQAVLTERDETVAKLEKELNEYKETKEFLDKSVEAKVETISGLNIKLAELEEAVSKNEDIQFQLESKNSYLQLELRDLQELSKSLKAELDLSADNNTSLKQQLQEQHSVMAERSAQIDQYVKQVEGMVEQIARLEACKQQEHDKHNEVMKLRDYEIESLTKSNDTMKLKLDEFEAVRDAHDKVLSELDEHKSSIARLQVEISQFDSLQQQNSDLETELCHKKAELTSFTLEKEEKIRELELKQAEKDEVIKDNYDKMAEQLRNSQSEVLRYKQMLEELEAKVAPFKEQLDSYETERQMLEGQSQNWASEVSKLSQEYAKLLGHQNHKQKIHRINKITEENFNLKKELMDLRNSEAKLKKQALHYQERIRSLEGKRKFDPSKAFQHPNKTVLKSQGVNLLLSYMGIEV